MNCTFCKREIKENEPHKIASIRTYIGDGKYKPTTEVLCDGPSMDEAKQKGLLPKDYGFPLFVPEESIKYFKEIRFCAEIFKALTTDYKDAGLLVGVDISKTGECQKGKKEDDKKE